MKSWRRYPDSAGSELVDSFFSISARLSERYAFAELAASVERVANIAYVSDNDRAHLLDFYRPRGISDAMPVVLYIHGGSFRMLSKDSHWMAGLQFASAGYLCAAINYRLAPRYPFPNQLEDVVDAVEWLLQNVETYGGDPTRLIVAGESAGANLALALAVAVSFRRPEVFARRAFDLSAPLRAVLPACGILEVTRPERFDDDPRASFWLVRSRIRKVTRHYLPGWSSGTPSVALADPLVVLESSCRAERPFPPTFVGFGGADPIAADSERLGRALAKRQIAHELCCYPKQPHAFQMLLWRDEAKRFWQDSFAFLETHLAEGMTPA